MSEQQSSAERTPRTGQGRTWLWLWLPIVGLLLVSWMILGEEPTDDPHTPMVVDNSPPQAHATVPRAALQDWQKRTSSDNLRARAEAFRQQTQLRGLARHTGPGANPGNQGRERLGLLTGKKSGPEADAKLPE